jgi:hypothetical protein
MGDNFAACYSTYIFSLHKNFQNQMKKLKTILVLALSIFAFSCGNNVQPNYEGVLQRNYGRNGESDFTLVTGRQGILGPGSELYQVPMFEQTADPEQVAITAKDAGAFKVDPTFTYQAIRGHGVKIIFNYKHVGVGNSETMMDNIEGSVLNKLVTNAYREEARNFTTDSLMNNLNAFESAVEKRLKAEFGEKHFQLNNLTSGLTPPESMGKAIEDRNKMVQAANTAKNELEVARMRLEKAKIEREENLVRAQGLDEKVLQEKWIEALRNTQNKVIITDGKVPLILNH